MQKCSRCSRCPPCFCTLFQNLNGSHLPALRSMFSSLHPASKRNSSSILPLWCELEDLDWPVEINATMMEQDWDRECLWRLSGWYLGMGLARLEKWGEAAEIFEEILTGSLVNDEGIDEMSLRGNIIICQYMQAKDKSALNKLAKLLDQLMFMPSTRGQMELRLVTLHNLLFAYMRESEDEVSLGTRLPEYLRRIVRSDASPTPEALIRSLHCLALSMGGGKEGSLVSYMTEIAGAYGVLALLHEKTLLARTCLDVLTSHSRILSGNATLIAWTLCTVYGVTPLELPPLSPADDEQPPYALYVHAHSLSHHQPLEALRAFARAAKQPSASPLLRAHSYNMMGICLHRLDKPNAAFVRWKQALGCLEGKDAYETIWNIASALRGREEEREILRVLADEILPEVEDKRYLTKALIRLTELLQQTASADVDHYLSLLLQLPGLPPTLRRQATRDRIWYLLASNQAEEAAKECRRVLAVDTNDIVCAIYLADALWRMAVTEERGEIEEGIRVLRRAELILEGVLRWKRELVNRRDGEMKMEVDMTPGNEEEEEKPVEEQEERPVVSRETIQKIHDSGLSARLFQDLATPTALKSRVHNNLAVLYYAGGRTEEAVAEMRKALVLDPENEQVAANLEEMLRR
ncbi:uncharacterized protein VTP21DRAFT_3724 [Calcarisporiella thermophila]|uniref:uncharacterized protein n=1 Tax=Calcarisporiella thermophila TaxID=911321 RepID=UPI003741ED18